MKWNEILRRRSELGHLLKVREVACLLGVTRQHVYNMMKAGEIPGVYRLSIRRTRICSATLLEWSRQRMRDEDPGQQDADPVEAPPDEKPEES